MLPENYFWGLGVFNTSAGIDHGEISQEYDPNMVYFSHHAVMQEGDRTNPYFHFTLKPGESAEYKIGYFARQDFIDNEQMMLSYGINKYASKIYYVMFEKNTLKVLKIFDGNKELKEYFKTKSIADINLCARGKRKTARGYKWSYFERSDDLLIK